MRLVVFSALLLGAVSQIQAAPVLDCCFRPGEGGFLYSRGTYSPVIVAGSLYTAASGINNAGHIVGYFSLPGDVPGTGLPRRGFVYDAGTLTSIEMPGAFETRASGINDAGQVVGDYLVGCCVAHGFLYSAGSYTTIDMRGLQTILADINNAGEIVGNVYGLGKPAYGFRYSDGVFTLIDAPGAAGWTFASGINNAGDIVGNYYDTNWISHGYLYRAGSFTTLDVPGAHETWARGINDVGQIVGWSRVVTSTGGFRDLGFLYTSGAFSTLRVHVPLSTGQIVTANSYANGINDAGRIVGQYSGGDIPEPASVLLLGPGLVGICAVGLWKRSRSRYT